MKDTTDIKPEATPGAQTDAGTGASHHAHRHKSIWGKVMGYLVPLIVTVGLCWVMFRNIDIKDMMSVIHDHCDFRWIGLALCISICSHVFRAMRWRIQLRALGINASLWHLILSIFGTYAVNLVFPRLGEVWRTGYIAHRTDSPFSKVFGSMVADRLADTVTVALLLLVTLILASSAIMGYLSQNTEMYHQVMGLLESPWLWLGGLVCVAVAWWLLTRKSAAGSLLSKLQDFAKGLWRGFAAVFTMPGKGKWLLLTCCLWGCYFVQLYVAFYAFPFTAAVIAKDGVTAAFVTFVLSSIAMGVPSNGGIGPWQWAVMFALGIYGVGQLDSGAFANLVMGAQTLLLILLGIFTFVCIMIEKKRHGK